MKIDSKLNLVVSVEEREGEAQAHFHSTPILMETYQRYHFPMAAAFTKLLSNNMQVIGPKIAALTLEDVSRELGVWEDAQEKKFIGVKNGLMEEIKRLTNVIAYTEAGWKSLPVADAIARGIVDEVDWMEANQRIVFFTLVCAMTSRGVKATLLEIMNDSWQTQTVSSSCTEWAASLPMLKETEGGSTSANPLSIPC